MKSKKMKKQKEMRKDQINRMMIDKYLKINMIAFKIIRIKMK